jgi:C2 domain/Permuted papain-like amidase enzyme, YaeF/YiiX, C92 family
MDDDEHTNPIAILMLRKLQREICFGETRDVAGITEGIANIERILQLGPTASTVESALFSFYQRSNNDNEEEEEERRSNNGRAARMQNRSSSSSLVVHGNYGKPSAEMQSISEDDDMSVVERQSKNTNTNTNTSGASGVALRERHKDLEGSSLEFFSFNLAATAATKTATTNVTMMTDAMTSDGDKSGGHALTAQKKDDERADRVHRKKKKRGRAKSSEGGEVLGRSASAERNDASLMGIFALMERSHQGDTIGDSIGDDDSQDSHDGFSEMAWFLERANPTRRARRSRHRSLSPRFQSDFASHVVQLVGDKHKEQKQRHSAKPLQKERQGSAAAATDDGAAAAADDEQQGTGQSKGASSSGALGLGGSKSGSARARRPATVQFEVGDDDALVSPSSGSSAAAASKGNGSSLSPRLPDMSPWECGVDHMWLDVCIEEARGLGAGSVAPRCKASVGDQHTRISARRGANPRWQQTATYCVLASDASLHIVVSDKRKSAGGKPRKVTLGHFCVPLCFLEHQQVVEGWYRLSAKPAWNVAPTRCAEPAPLSDSERAGAGVADEDDHGDSGDSDEDAPPLTSSSSSSSSSSEGLGLIYVRMHYVVEPNDGVLAHEGIEMYSLPKRLTTGDILVFSSRRILSYAAKIATASTWDHVAMVVCIADTPFLLEATHPDGVDIYNIEEKLAYYRKRCRIGVRKLHRGGLPTDKGWLRSLLAFVKECRGRPYETNLGVFIKSARASHKASDNADALQRMFCSSLVAACYQKMRFVPEDLVVSNVLPKDFASNDFQLDGMRGGFLQPLVSFKKVKSHHRKKRLSLLLRHQSQ